MATCTLVSIIWYIWLGTVPLVTICATLFRARRTTAGGDGMRKKDTEIPHERAFS
jgi:hypothetical protein